MEKRDPPAYQISTIIADVIRAVDELNRAVDAADAMGLDVGLKLNPTNGTVSAHINLET